MSSSWQQAAQADPMKPSIARVYDYWLGGSHNFVADRELGRRIETLDPWIPATARANRDFLGRVVRFLTAECGIRQFLDIGSGIPTVGNVHEISQQAAPDAHVVYVDYDPVAVSMSRDLLASNDHAEIIKADLRRPDEILAHPVFSSLIDITKPTAILFISILHFVVDAEEPYKIVARFRDAVTPGSYLVLSHATHDDNPQLAAAVNEVYTARAADGQTRSREEISAFFGNWHMAEPGLVYAPVWRPDELASISGAPERFWLLAGAARKP